MPVYAESLYFSLIEQATISDEILAKTQQQLEKYQPVKIKEITLPPFHKRGEQISKESTFCTFCHLPLPHQNNVRVRTFLNMHTRYIACETCHFEAKGLNYRWLPEKFSNETMAKITPFYQGKPILSNHALFQEIKIQWKNLPLLEQAKLKAKIHHPLTEVTCKQCHGQNFLDLRGCFGKK